MIEVTRKLQMTFIQVPSLQESEWYILKDILAVTSNYGQIY